MKQTVTRYNVSVVGSNLTGFTVNNSVAGCAGQSHSAGTPVSRPTATSVAHGQVIVTPLPTVFQSVTHTGTVSNMMGLQRQLVISRLEASVGMVSKVQLKAVGSAKKDSKTFTLRNVDTIIVNTQEK